MNRFAWRTIRFRGGHGRQWLYLFKFLTVVAALAGLTLAFLFSVEDAAATVDTTPPVIFQVGPSGWLDGTSSTIFATYYDPESGIDYSQTSMSLLLTSPWQAWNTPYSCAKGQFGMSCQMTPTDTLPEGHYNAMAVVTNMVGLYSLGFGAFDVDTQSPVITDISPSGTVSGLTSIDAEFIDPGHSSGINAGSAGIVLDNVYLTQCIRVPGIGGFPGVISCPVGIVGPGTHTITAWVDDNIGHEAFTGGSFTLACSGNKPAIVMNRNRSYWASQDDYQARQLSVDFNVLNNGPHAYGLTVLGAGNTNGVDTAVGAFPITVGDVWAGYGTDSFTVVYSVPPGVGSFITSLSGSASDQCGSSFTYP